jgi:hypothetical protein
MPVTLVYAEKVKFIEFTVRQGPQPPPCVPVGYSSR